MVHFNEARNETRIHTLKKLNRIFASDLPQRIHSVRDEYTEMTYELLVNGEMFFVSKLKEKQKYW